MRLLLAALLLAAGAAVVGVQAADADRDTSESFSFATYRAIDGRVTLLADGFPASLHDEDAYIPIPVALALRGKGPRVTVTPESFTLIDPMGTAYPAADYGEVLEHYRKLDFDRSLLRARPLVVGNQFALDLRLASNFYPASGTGVRTSRVQLARSTWLADVIYFPRPAAGLGGVLTLRVSGGGIAEPVEVRLRVPLQGRERA